MMAANEVVCTPKVETADNMTKSLNKKSRIGIINSRIDGSIFLLIKRFLIILLSFCESQKPIVKISSAKPTFIPKEMMSLDRKSTRLNSSHVAISYAVFCLKKKKNYNKYR